MFVSGAPSFLFHSPLFVFVIAAMPFLSNVQLMDGSVTSYPCSDRVPFGSMVNVADSFAFPADGRLCSALYRKDAAFFIDDGGSVCHGVYDGGISVEVKRSVLTVLYGWSGIFFLHPVFRLP